MRDSIGKVNIIGVFNGEGLKLHERRQRKERTCKQVGLCSCIHSSLSKCSNLVSTTCLLVSSTSPARNTSSRIA